MKPRRTHESTQVIGLLGGNEDNDLWVDATDIEGDNPEIHSCWVPTDQERAEIAAGRNIELTVHSAQHPPVSMRTTAVPLGKGTRGET